MGVAGFNSGPNYAATSPRLSAVRDGTKSFRAGKIILPGAMLFTMCGIAYTLTWNRDRQKDGVCIDCARQKEMMEEVYFNNGRPKVHKGYRL